MEIWPGEPFPMGATFDGSGCNFSLFSEVAERVELCLFDEDGTETRVDLPEVTAFVHHGYLPGIQPGQRYGFRVHGPWAPEQGSRCNPEKLLIDPYAKAVDGGVEWAEAVFPYSFDDGPDGPPTDSDSGPFIPKSIVVNPYFDWADDRHPRRPVARDRRLRDPRQGPHQAPPRRAGGPPRHLPRPVQPAGDRPPHRPRRHRGRAHAGAPVRARLPPRPGGAAQLLGLQLHRLPGTAQRVRGVRPAGPAGAGVQADGEDPAPGGHRGHPRRGLQPHRRGQRRRPAAVAQGRRQRRLLPAEPRRPPPLRRLHRHRQQPEHAPPARAAADHGLACATGSPRCASTASASTSPPPSPASCTTSTSSRRSSTSSSRTRSSAR